MKHEFRTGTTITWLMFIHSRHNAKTSKSKDIKQTQCTQLWVIFPVNSFHIFKNLPNIHARHYLLYKVCTDSDHVHTVHCTAIMCILYTAQRSCAYCTLVTAIMCILYTAQRSCAYCTLHSDHVHTVHCTAIMCILYTGNSDHVHNVHW